MITAESIKELAIKFQTTEQNIAREYCQHLFLSYFYRKDGADKFLFKGGTALRIVFGNPRFSEDLDFSASNGNEVRTNNPKLYKLINKLVDSTIDDIKKEGIECKKEIKEETGSTKTGYFAIIKFGMLDFPSEIKLQISFRTPRVTGKNILIKSELVPSYILSQLEERFLISEKIMALLARKIPRDFFDLYFILRSSNLRKFIPQRKGLKRAILEAMKKAGNFEEELKILLPKNHHAILKNLSEVLKKEIEQHIS